MSKIKQISVYGENGWSQPYDIGPDADKIGYNPISLPNSDISTATNVKQAIDTLGLQAQGYFGVASLIANRVQALETNLATTSSNGLMSAEDKGTLNYVSEKFSTSPSFLIKNSDLDYTLQGCSTVDGSGGAMTFWPSGLTSDGYMPICIIQASPTDSRVVVRGTTSKTQSGQKILGVNLKNLTTAAVTSNLSVKALLISTALGINEIN